MTASEFKKYFEAMFFKTWNKKPGKEDKKLISSAVSMGMADFCGAYHWAFREKHDTITTTESVETVDLPSDFTGIVSLRERTSASGYNLHKYEPDKYDRIIPDSTALNEGTPKIYKVYYDDMEGVWRVALYPTPDAAITLYLSYHSNDTGIPNKYVGGVTIAIAKHLANPGSPEWITLNNAFMVEVERLMVVDNVDVATISKVLDSSDEPMDWDFSEYVRVGQG